MPARSADPDPAPPPIGFRAAWRAWSERILGWVDRWAHPGKVCRSCGYRAPEDRDPNLGPPVCPRCGTAFDPPSA